MTIRDYTPEETEFAWLWAEANNVPPEDYFFADKGKIWLDGCPVAHEWCEKFNKAEELFLKYAREWAL